MMDLFGDFCQVITDAMEYFSDLWDSLSSILNDTVFPRKKMAKKKFAGRQPAVCHPPRKRTMCIEYPTGFA